jgi:ring-1,2-phenylacetyl-CoA epoxidase subunit PaaD
MTVHTADKQTIYSYLEEIKDPEVPVLSIVDLGIVRDVLLCTDDVIEVVITPTYTGCPAMDVISMNIRRALMEKGCKDVIITKVLSPAWTTDWMSEEGKRKLKEYGIAPPDKRFSIPKDGVPCPRCKSTQTKLISEFGSTACKALYQCGECGEPFDYFKCH